MSVKQVSSVFSLSPAEDKLLRGAYTAKRKTIDELAKIATLRRSNAALLAGLRAELLAEIASVSPAPASATTTAPVAPVAAPTEKPIVWYLPTGATHGAPYTGQQLAIGTLIQRDGDTTWSEYRPVSATTAPAAPVVATTAPVTVSATTDPATIPISPSGKGFIPWVLGARVSGKDGRIFAQIGSAKGAPYNRCTVLLDELLVSLEPQNVQAMRAELLRLQSELA